MNGREIATVVIGLTIVAALFTPITTIVGDTVGNDGEVVIEGSDYETVYASIGEPVDLDGYNIVEDSETVEYDNGTAWVEATRGTDYEMDYGSGAITALEGGAINDGQELRVSYTYESTSSTTSTVANLVPLLFALLMLVVLASRVEEAF